MKRTPKEAADLEAAYHDAMVPDPSACSRCDGHGGTHDGERFGYCDCPAGVEARAIDSAPPDPETEIAVRRAMGRFYQHLRRQELERAKAPEDDGDWT